MSATRGLVSRTESGSYFVVLPDLAGVHRSGKTRLVAPESQGLAAESLNIIPGNQPADCASSREAAKIMGYTTRKRKRKRKR